MLLWLLACLPSLKPEGTVLDTAAVILPDEDGDGFDTSTDCDDTNPDVNPGADELCDGVDTDCDGFTPAEELDDDGDGFAECEGDCDDSRSDVYPDASEPCDYVDNDCDGETDEDGLSVFYADTDEDGYGDPAVGSEPTCGAPEGYVADDTDCDDANAEANPGLDELCATEWDDDCDGDINEDDAADVPTWYADADEDTFGDDDVSWVQCEAPEGAVSDNTDCDDTDETVNPDASEICNGVDDDCDGVVPSDETDDDGDGYVECTGEDCDDTRDDIYLGADETCGNGEDEDCDGLSDEDDAIDATTWYLDSDQDGDGDPTQTDVECEQPNGYVDNDDDCDDSDDTVYDGATEICDGQDNDCDGVVPSDETDDDGDGYVECTLDSGGWDGSTPKKGGDCDDTRAATSPAADEYCDGTHDDDCDGTVDEDTAVDVETWYADTDIDGYGDASNTDIDCDQPSGYVADNTDCDDGDGDTYPGAPEVCGDGVLNDCNASSTDECGPYGSWDLEDAQSIILGDGTEDYAGYRVGGGDVNGDGTDDVILISVYGGQGYGDAAVFFGPLSAGTQNMADADVLVDGIIPSQDDDAHYVSLAALLGDLTDNGSDDLVVSSQGDSAVYIFEGPVTGGSLDMDDAALYVDPRTSDVGDAGDEIASLDLDDDGYEDLVLGAPSWDDDSWNIGGTYIVHGPLSTDLDDVDSEEGDTAIEGYQCLAYVGWALASGDFDADGQDELVVSAPGSSYEYYCHAYVSSSSTKWQVGVFEDLSQGNEGTLTELAEQYYEGTGGDGVGSALDIGDQNGDGYDDLLIGAGASASAYVINGPLNHSSTSINNADATITGPSTTGYSVAMNGDISGDGNDDIVVNAYDQGSTSRGTSYFFEGPLTGTFAHGSRDGTWTGTDNYDYSGYAKSLTYAGDTDGDGYDDVLVGAAYAEDGKNRQGISYLLLGGPNY